jgi:hypothetical protein|eukprot:gene6386-4590_t
MAESTPQAAAPASENLELIIEGWGAKQGTKYPNWNVRWFVLEKKTPEPDSLEVLDTRDYFKHSSDSYERAHNYNSSNDKANLVLSYYVDESKTELKERFEFTPSTYWTVQKPRVTAPKFNGGPIEAIYLFCEGSNGSKKLVFTPFWGFVEPTFNLLCQPWVLCMEHARPRAYDGENDTYYSDLAKVDEDTFGRTTKDLEAKLEQFKGCFVDDVTFKPYKESPMKALSLFLPIKFLGKNGQDDDPAADRAKIEECTAKQTEWQMKFNKKMKELNEQKLQAGSREQWLKYVAQARHRGMKYDAWMQIKDADGNYNNLPAHLK